MKITTEEEEITCLWRSLNQMTEEELLPLIMAYSLGVPCQVFNNHRGRNIWIDCDDSWNRELMLAAVDHEGQQFRIKPNDSETT